MRTRSFSLSILLVSAFALSACNHAQLYKVKKAMRGWESETAQQRAVWHSSLEGRELTVPLDQNEPEFGLKELLEGRVTWVKDCGLGADGRPLIAYREQWLSRLEPHREIKRTVDPKTGKTLVNATATFWLPEQPDGEVNLVLGNQYHVVTNRQLAGD